MRVKGTQRLDQLRSKRARVVLTSGGLEPVEDNEGGEHSVFAQEFLRALEENRGHLDLSLIHI